MDAARHTGLLVKNHIRDSVRQVGTGIYEADLRELSTDRVASRFQFLLTQYPYLRILTLTDDKANRKAEALPDGEVDPDELSAYSSRIPFEQVMENGVMTFSEV